MDLREPAHQVSPRAVGYWRLTAAGGAAVGWVTIGVLFVVLPEHPTWLVALLVLAAVLMLVPTVVMPPLRYRVHRWEVTPTAVVTRSGWISREQRVAPLSRVQTVDSSQSGLMRLFKLRSITVTTASAAGPLLIQCLDEQVAERVAADLTVVAGEAIGDGT